MENKLEQKYMTVQEAARTIQVTDGTIRAAISDGRLPATLIYGRKVVTPSDLEEYRRRARPTGEKRLGRPRKLRESVPPASLSDLTTQAALNGAIGEIWDTPEEDEAWVHLGLLK